MLDAWAREREHWAAAKAAERALWRVRAAGGTAEEEARRAEVVWEMVRGRMSEWEAHDRRAYHMGMHVTSKVAAAEVATATGGGGSDAVMEQVALEWMRTEEAAEARRWRERKAGAMKELKRLLWEVADCKLRKWDAEDGAGAGAMGTAPASVDQSDDSEEEEEKKREEERASAECMACSGLPSNGYRQAMLRAFMDCPWEVGSEGSAALLREFFERHVKVTVQAGGRFTVTPIPEY